jgi:hypothetical protein
MKDQILLKKYVNFDRKSSTGDDEPCKATHIQIKQKKGKK